MGDINITLGGDLNVRKAAGGPVTVAGTINTVRGTYQFQGRQFEIARNGTLRFTGGADFNPVLDLTATRQIPDTGVEARVRITGSLQTPALALSSTPPLEESDVLALIVFNRPINELGTRRTRVARRHRRWHCHRLHRRAARRIHRPRARPRSLRDHDVERGRHVGRRLHGRRTDWRSDVPQAAPAVRRAHLQRVPAGVSDHATSCGWSGSAAPETSGAANRIGQRRIERAGLDLIFFFSY